MTNVDAIVESLHRGCGYEHEGYAGPCGTAADLLIAEGERRVRESPQPGTLEYAQMIALAHGDLDDETEEEAR